MFGIGFGEFMLIMVIALLVIGPDKLPGIARSVARAFNEIKRTGNDLKRTMTDLDIPDPAKVVRGLRDATNSMAEGIRAVAEPGEKKGKKAHGEGGTKEGAGPGAAVERPDVDQGGAGPGTGEKPSV